MSTNLRTSRPVRSGRRLRVAGAVALVVALVVLDQGASGEFVDLATIATIFSIAAVGQDLLMGRSGQVSLGGGALVAVGSFSTAYTTSHTFLGQFPIPLLAAALVGFVVGAVVGLVVLRLRSIYLLVATIALQYVVVFVAQEVQGLNEGGFAIPSPHIGSLQLGSPRNLLLVCLVVLAVVIAILANLYKQTPGKAWQAIRESEHASRGLGISVVRWKVLAFACSCAVTAVAGSLYAYNIALVSYGTFDLQFAILVITIVYVGGTGTMLGPILGSIFVTLVPYAVQQIANAQGSLSSTGLWLSLNASSLGTLIYAVGLTAVLLAGGRGLIDVIATVTGHARRRARHGETGAAPRSLRDLVTLAAAADLAHAVDTAPPQAAPPQTVPDPFTATDQTPATASNGLHVRGLSVIYRNGNVGVAEVSLSVHPGEIIAIIGRNGAGKTTLLKTIAGLPRSSGVIVGGAVTWEGAAVLGASITDMTRQGVVLVPERDKVFPELTVREHFVIAAGHSAGRDPQAALTQLPGLSPLVDRIDARAGLLSGGQKQMLSMCMAALGRPRLMLIDELSLGLAPAMVTSLMQLTRELATNLGMSVLIVDQNARACAHVADAVYVMDRGVITHDGRDRAISERELVEAFLG